MPFHVNCCAHCCIVPCPVCPPWSQCFWSLTLPKSFFYKQSGAWLLLLLVPARFPQPVLRELQATHRCPNLLEIPPVEETMKVIILYLPLLSQFNFGVVFVNTPLLLTSKASCRTNLLYMGVKLTPDYNNIR